MLLVVKRNHIIRSWIRQININQVCIRLNLFQKQVIKQKHTGDMSLAMALLGTVQSTLWFLYALTLGNYIEIVSSQYDFQHNYYL